ncbi:MAG: Gfo/Idh/MocA family oxidoreductase [Dehalococcoidia bacterium]|nr:Gfo/Idh/MocA family oxidoreductase [Dehalococcoidia bacterium]
MRVLTDKWADGYLDYARGPGQYRVAVRRWHVVAPITGMFFPVAADWRRALNYLREIGFISLARKALSRYRERQRNHKYVAIGVGEVLERYADAPLRQGQLVVFLAPGHPRCLERVVLPQEFVRPMTQADSLKSLSQEGLLFSEGAVAEESVAVFMRFAGWSELSGLPLDVGALKHALAEAERLLAERGTRECVTYHTAPPSGVGEVHDKPARSGSALRAVTWGYGHQMKTMVIPNMGKHFYIARVHEVDPLQVGDVQRFPFSADTSPTPRPDERYDVHLVAGFHHTHGPLAVHALSQGAAVVVEKPLVTTSQQLDDVLKALADGRGRLFGGFHKRYLPFNAVALRDLGVTAGGPVSYHAIVHEVPIPPFNWYRWPNSGSGLLSHGCHWIDHFLFLNRFSPVKSSDVWEADNEDIFATMELENGATFSLTLTHQGSSRIGVQEHIELMAKGVTVRIQNSSRYVAEDNRRIIRRMRASKTAPYAAMYRAIAQRIIRGEPGDDVTATERSARAVLVLEERLQAKRREARRATASVIP